MSWCFIHLLLLYVGRLRATLQSSNPKWWAQLVALITQSVAFILKCLIITAAYKLSSVTECLCVFIRRTYLLQLIPNRPGRLHYKVSLTSLFKYCPATRHWSWDTISLLQFIYCANVKEIATTKQQWAQPVAIRQARVIDASMKKWDLAHVNTDQLLEFLPALL